MRGRIVAKKKKVAEEASNQLSTKKKVPKVTKNAEADENGRQLTKLLDRALKDCVDLEDDIAGNMAGATVADCTAPRPFALQLAKVYKPCALQIKKTELMEGVGDTHGI